MSIMEKKTSLSAQAVEAFLKERITHEIKNVRPMQEGEVSQAFSFEWDKSYVIRINRSIVGFQKDAYAYKRFHSDRIPIPEVIQIGHIDEQHAFCITERIPGLTLQDVDHKTIKQLLQPTANIWFALQEYDLSHTSGYGDFDADGRGQYPTWRAYLLSILNIASSYRGHAESPIDQTLLNDIIAIFTSFIQHCPEERHLVHGDFGSNNILADGNHITAVLDWDCAKYGDPLFDVATAYFWSTWLDCMAAQATYYETHLAQLPRYRERLLCYQLHIGLSEIFDNILHHDWQMTQWAIRRCAGIANNSLPHPNVYISNHWSEYIIET
jgi:hygromycin-B 4-O-kinase